MKRLLALLLCLVLCLSLIPAAAAEDIEIIDIEEEEPITVVEPEEPAEEGTFEDIEELFFGRIGHRRAVLPAGDFAG